MPLLSSTAKNLVAYKYFETSIQQVASLIATLDPLSEESLKVRND